MASSRGTSNGVDWKDIALAVVAFEEQCRCRFILTMRSCPDATEPDLWWEAKAVGIEGASVVPVLLASAQCRCGQEQYRTMEAAILFLLYQLDFQLGEREWAKTRSGETAPGAKR